MGLDMYLRADRYFWDNPPSLDEVPEGYTVHSVRVEVAYWRKANHIHKWFVENVQEGEDDCRPYAVTVDQLTQLRDLCKDALDNRSMAKTLLPREDGFFFGDTSYGEDYFQDLKDTIKMLDRVLEPARFDPRSWDFIYDSSW